MKGITLCADCAYYSMKKHKCTRGAIDEGEPTARFYADCPLDDVVPVVRCRECKHFVQGDPYDPCECMKWTVKWGVAYTNPDDFCSYGERKDNDSI